jgi:3-deoxy-7-phosphoheptulonate synthase
MDLLSPKSSRSRHPLPLDVRGWIHSQRETIQQIISGEDPRIALVVGPCSIHNSDSALLFAEQVKNLQAKVEETFLLVMRVYVEKSRSALGWKGFLYDPYLDGSHDVLSGIAQTRELLLRIAQKGVPSATEFVDPLMALYYEDLISWGFIGARTSSSPPHRQLASSLSCPMGFKNGLDGCLDDAILGILTCSSPQVFPSLSLEGRLTQIESLGDPSAHLVLRGSLKEPNYDRDSVMEALESLEAVGLPKRLMIDCSHGNCERHYARQQTVFFHILENCLDKDYPLIGMMLESHLEEGSQPMGGIIKSTVSITDPCLSWESTESMILKAHTELGLGSKSRSSAS